MMAMDQNLQIVNLSAIDNVLIGRIRKDEVLLDSERSPLPRNELPISRSMRQAYWMFFRMGAQKYIILLLLGDTCAI